MHLSHTAFYALRLSLNQAAATPAFYRRSVVDRGTATSAFLLATIGLCISMFSLKQMQSSPEHQCRLRKLR